MRYRDYMYTEFLYSLVKILRWWLPFFCGTEVGHERKDPLALCNLSLFCAKIIKLFKPLSDGSTRDYFDVYILPLLKLHAT